MDSILQYTLFVHIDDDQVLTDFLSFIPENEKQSFLEGERLIAEGNCLQMKHSCFSTLSKRAGKVSERIVLYYQK